MASQVEMSQCELMALEKVRLEESMSHIHDMICTLKGTPIQGPLEPALRHLEEAEFWLQKCHDAWEENRKQFVKNT